MHINIPGEHRHIHKHNELYLSTDLDVGQMFGGHRQVVQLKRSTNRKENTGWHNYSHRTRSSLFRFSINMGEEGSKLTKPKR